MLRLLCPLQRFANWALIAVAVLGLVDRLPAVFAALEEKPLTETARAIFPVLHAGQWRLRISLRTFRQSSSGNPPFDLMNQASPVHQTAGLPPHSRAISTAAAVHCNGQQKHHRDPHTPTSEVEEEGRDRYNSRLRTWPSGLEWPTRGQPPGRHNVKQRATPVWAKRNKHNRARVHNADTTDSKLLLCYKAGMPKYIFQKNHNRSMIVKNEKKVWRQHLVSSHLESGCHQISRLRSSGGATIEIGGGLLSISQQFCSR